MKVKRVFFLDNSLVRELGAPARPRRSAPAESGAQSFRDWAGQGK